MYSPCFLFSFFNPFEGLPVLQPNASLMYMKIRFIRRMLKNGKLITRKYNLEVLLAKANRLALAD